MKSSLPKASQKEMILNPSRFSQIKFGTGYVAFENQLSAHESEHDETDIQRDDYKPCEIPPA